MYKLGASKIHGIGVIAESFISKGVVVDDVVLNYVVTPHFGRWINHSRQPNCKMVQDGTSLRWVLVTMRDISSGEELTVNYWDTPSFIAKPDKLGIKEG